MGTRVSIAFNKKLGAGFFGGEGFILQKLQGDGKAFLHAGGTVAKELRGETLRVDTGCIVAFDGTVDYDIEMVGSLRACSSAARGCSWRPCVDTGRCGCKSAVQPPGRQF